MARIDVRLRAMGWLARRQLRVDTMSEADLGALQARRIPANAVTNWLLGAVPPGIGVTDRTVPGPAATRPSPGRPATPPTWGRAARSGSWERAPAATSPP